MCDEYFWAQNAFCDCKTPCNDITYSQTVTTVPWPNAVNQLAFYDKYIKPYPEIYGNKFDEYGQVEEQIDNLNVTEIVALIEKINLIPMNFIQLNVQMAHQMQTINADIPSVTWDTLFANLGGTLNLWMGITVLFAAEVVEVVSQMLMLHFSKPQAAHRDRDPEISEKTSCSQIKKQ